MRNAFIAALYELAEKDKDIMILVADNGAIVFDRFRADFPDQFLNCGIAEANMVGFAAGLALSGKKPFIYTISNFMTMRALEQIRNDICLQNANVKIVGIGGGFAYSTLGPTHHATEDISVMRALPNLTVICPASPMDVSLATKAMSKIDTPVFLRMGTNREPEIYKRQYPFEIGKGVVLKEGRDITIVVSGPLSQDVLEAAGLLKEKGIESKIINIHTIKPIDKDLILSAAKETGALMTVENNTVVGGLGSAVAEVLAEQFSGSLAFKRLGIRDCFCTAYGSHSDLKKQYGLDPASIAQEAAALIKNQMGG